jgi:DNA-binding transcriptional regulator YdaS (Cro superfamily)
MLEIVKEAAEVVGGLPVLADKLGVTRQAIHQWEQVPRQRVLDIEMATDGKVSRSKLRPDIYAPDHDPYVTPAAANSAKDAAA